MLEFDVGGHTIWVHSPKGETVLRIKTRGVRVNTECQNTVSHADLSTDEGVNFCLHDDDDVELE